MGTTKVELSGGPAGHDTKLLVDGVEAKGVHRVELTVDVSDLIRVRTFQFAEAIVEVEGDVIAAYRVRVNIREGDGWKVLATATADSIWQALADCAKQLEFAAKGSVVYTET